MGKMRNKRALWVALLVLGILAIPLYVVISNELKLADQDHVFKFKCEARDPIDIMRGRYIRLTFNNTIEDSLSALQTFPQGQKVFVTVGRDKNGWGVFKSISDKMPDHPFYFETRILYSWRNINQFDIPFDKFFMNEEDAPKAEKAYTEGVFLTNAEIYAEVTIKNGTTILRDVYINGETMHDYIQSH
jgi:uncharacterized membrane-anchored protein